MATATQATNTEKPISTKLARVVLRDEVHKRIVEHNKAQSVDRVSLYSRAEVRAKDILARRVASICKSSSGLKVVSSSVQVFHRVFETKSLYAHGSAVIKHGEDRGNKTEIRIDVEIPHTQEETTAHGRLKLLTTDRDIIRDKVDLVLGRHRLIAPRLFVHSIPTLAEQAFLLIRGI